MAAGQYAVPFEWYSAPLSNPDSFGEKSRPLTFIGTLWGVIEDRVAVEVEELSRTIQQVQATIRVRNYPAILPMQVLTDPGGSESWTVTTAYRGDNETICNVVRR